MAVWRGEEEESSPRRAATAFLCSSLDKKVKPEGEGLLPHGCNADACVFCVSFSDAGVGVIVLPSAAVQVPRRSVGRAGELFMENRMWDRPGGGFDGLLRSHRSSRTCSSWAR